MFCWKACAVVCHPGKLHQAKLIDDLIINDRVFDRFLHVWKLKDTLYAVGFYLACVFFSFFLFLMAIILVYSSLDSSPSLFDGKNLSSVFLKLIKVCVKTPHVSL